MAWKEITEDRYDEMLEVLPPVAMSGVGFMMGEPMDHDDTGAALFLPFRRVGARYFEGEPMTVAAFRAVKPSDLVTP
jgi:hypothetical protein